MCSYMLSRQEHTSLRDTADTALPCRLELTPDGKS